MRTKKHYTEGETTGFDLSISDLMSGLCGIFILIMIAVILQLNTTKSEYMAKNKKAEDYYSMQKALYDELPVIREQTKLWTVKYFFAASTTLYIAIDIAIVRKIALFCLFAETIAFAAFLWEKMRYKRKILNWIVKIENSF